MDIKTTTHRSRVGRGRPMAIALAAVFALALPVPAFAQDASEAPASTAPSAEATESGVAFPVMLGGQLLTAENYSGPEWLALFAEGDSADPAFVEGTEALLAAAHALTDALVDFIPSPQRPMLRAKIAEDMKKMEETQATLMDGALSTTSPEPSESTPTG